MTHIKIFALILFAFLASCAHQAPTKSELSENKSTTYSSAANAAAPKAQDRITADSDRRVGDTQTPTALKVSLDQTEDSQKPVGDQVRKIIRNADLQLEAASPEASLEKITAIAEGKGGFVVESQQSSSDVKTTGHDTVTMTVRVPSEKFNETLEAIRGSADRVIIENVKGEDVTEEFIDIEARLKAQKALEAQFIEIMKRANSVDQALSVQRELAEVRGEIEKIEGRKRFLEDRSSLSTITIRLQTPTAFSRNSSGFFYRLTESFSSGLDFALDFLLGLVTFVVAILPFAIIFGVPGFFIARYFWKRRGRPRSFSEIADEELDSK